MRAMVFGIAILAAQLFSFVSPAQSQWNRITTVSQYRFRADSLERCSYRFRFPHVLAPPSGGVPAWATLAPTMAKRDFLGVEYPVGGTEAWMHFGGTLTRGQVIQLMPTAPFDQQRNELFAFMDRNPNVSTFEWLITIPRIWPEDAGFELSVSTRYSTSSYRLPARFLKLIELEENCS